MNGVVQAYPLPSFNYIVTIMHDGVAETIGFSEVSGLSVTADPMTYRDGLSFRLGYAILPGRRNSFQLTLRRGLSNSASFLYDWFSAATSGGKADGIVRDIVIDLCDEKGRPVTRWIVGDAIPTRLDAPEFNASGDQIAIVSLQVIAQSLKAEFF